MGNGLRLADITPDNIDKALRIKVAPEQEAFVAPVSHSLAEA